MGSVTLGPRAWLIAYDICDRHRLYRVHKALKKVAIPVQYSVFVAWISEPQVTRLRGDLLRLIEPAEDDVRMYHLPAVTVLHTLGPSLLPEDVQIVGELDSMTTNFGLAQTNDVLFPKVLASAGNASENSDERFPPCP